MSKLQLADKRHPQEMQDKAKREAAPWWRKDSKRIKSELITATPKERKEYMETGITPPKRNVKCKKKPKS